jgi:hypothetical protein
MVKTAFLCRGKYILEAGGYYEKEKQMDLRFTLICFCVELYGGDRIL